MRDSRPTTLAVDIGGSGIKAMRLDPRGRPASERLREKTPHPATPAAVLRVVRSLAARLAPYDRVSLGFPGVVENGVVRTATNLHPAWVGIRPATRLRLLLRKPVRIANDADVQGLGIVEGRGVELVLTLGTGIGSALFLDGRLIPNLELGHHPFRRGRTYEELLGDRALRRIGLRRWNRRLRRAVQIVIQTFNVRRLYLGGGNARGIRGTLPARIEVASNLAGLLGGIRLWDESDGLDHASARRPGGARSPRAGRRAVSRSARTRRLAAPRSASAAT
jgi:polyphosphate glucokinase